MPSIYKGDLEDQKNVTIGKTGGLLLKRVIDVIISLVGLIVMAPVFLLIAVVIRRQDSGPVFFVQKRSGQHGRVFRMYKFRTMVPDAEQLKVRMNLRNDADGPVFKSRDDPRVTRFGRFLRKYHVDEFPQLLNVLKGEMSIVGPRPLPVEEMQSLGAQYDRRLDVAQGLTCFWQVEGGHQMPFEKWMESDIRYVDEWSLLVDFRIMFKTVFHVFRGLGC